MSQLSAAPSSPHSSQQYAKFFLIDASEQLKERPLYIEDKNGTRIAVGMFLCLICKLIKKLCVKLFSSPNPAWLAAQHVSHHKEITNAMKEEACGSRASEQLHAFIRFPTLQV